MEYEDAHNGRGLSGAHGPNPARSIIGAEDEDFENDLHQTVDDQCSHFNSIELLKTRPTHLLVFLHHVILQFDCAPLLCYLHADLIKNLSDKDIKKAFMEFYNKFLDKGAILRVPVPQNVSNEFDRNRPDLTSEDMQRRFAQDIQYMQAPEVVRQLDDFRKKRMMGMTPNELELTEVENHYQTDRVPREMKEKAVAERLLEKLFESNPSIVADEDKGSAIFTAVGVYMKQLGVKTRVADSKKSRGFFKRKAPKKEEGKGIRGILVEAGRYLPSVRNNDGKRLDTEGDRNNHERKGSGVPAHSAPSSEGTAAPSLGRKPGLPVLGTVQSMEAAEAPLSTTVTPSPDPSHAESAQSSIPSDHRPGSEGGDASPGISVPVCDLTVTVDIPVEESNEKDRRKTRSVRRSESLCVDRRHSRRTSGRAKQSRSRSDVDLQSAASSHPPSPSPHHSFVDVNLFPAEVSSPSPVAAAQHEEIEPRLLELEQDPANWRELASSEALSKLSKKEIKRQEVINELFVTEHAHVRMLSVLQTVFAHPLEKEEIINSQELHTIFPSLDDIIEVHYTFYQNLKKLRQEDDYVVKKISTPLLNRFNGSEGDWFQKLSARFCSHQSYTLVQIKNRQKKDPRFNAFILEAESKPQCRRLQLKDIIPIEMQRLTKYPLLLENIAKSTEDDEEKELIQQAAESCRKILNHVNEEVKHMENLLTLKDYQRRLDTSGLKPSNELYMEYKGLDLTTRSMIFEGPLTWRVTKEKALDVQAVLLGDLLVLLQKQDDKMVLKCQSKSPLAVQEGKQMLSPVIKLDSAFLRDVATDRKAFYVIFTWESGAQIYELVAQSVAERKIWTDSIKAAVDELKKSGGPVPDRRRLGSMPASSSPMAYTMSSHPPLSPTENGPKNSTGKDSHSDEKGRQSQPSLIDYLTASGFDPLSYSNSPPERAAPGAVDEVINLKTLLVGDLCLSDEAKSEGESGAESGKQEKETDGVEEHNAEGQEDGGDESAKRDSERKIAAPLILSQEHTEDVSRKLDSLLEQIKRLQAVEEEHHRLQEALAKFTIQRVNYN